MYSFHIISDIAHRIYLLKRSYLVFKLFLTHVSCFFNSSDLKSENRSLKKYIDNLMVILMEQFPEALEAISAIPLTKK